MGDDEFIHQTLRQRVRFGRGQAAQHVFEEVRSHDSQRVMAIATKRAQDQALQVTSLIDVSVQWDEVTQHVPAKLAVRATMAAREAGIDLIVSIGGGSTTGLAKAIALDTAIPIIAVPTTYSGSEATNMWGMTEDDTKNTGLDDRVLPTAVIYDADLVATLPMDLTVASALNAMAHCIDSLWAPNADPINQVNALEGARALAHALRRMHADPEDLDARGEAFYGCYLAAVAFASAGSGLHHKICHVLGGTFNLSHAQTHAIMLPHILAFNEPAVPELAKRLSQALTGDSSDQPHGDRSALAALLELYDQLSAPRTLGELGFTAPDIPEAVSRTLKVSPASNPRPTTESNLTQLLTNALNGRFSSIEDS